MSTSTDSVDAPTKTRLLSHMNTSHTEDLRLYLRHLKPELPASALENPWMTDITLSSLSIRSEGQTHVLPINPPMATWADRRARLIKLSEDAAKALGVPVPREGDHAVVTTWRAPEGFDVVVLTSLLFYYTSAALVMSGNLPPSSELYRLADLIGSPLVPFLPGDSSAGEWFVWLTKAILIPVLGIHITEMWWFDRSRLSVRGKSGLTRGGGAWVMWMLSAFFEGAPAMWRFDRVLAEASKGAKKH